MSTYVVGDLQGCLAPLKTLLHDVQFNDDRDQLWLAGDLVNRGPQSLDTLAFLYPRRDNIVNVLGNHDLHLLACAFGHRLPSKGDTLDGIITAADSSRYYEWLRSSPLLHHDTQLGYTMVHAGIPPCWDLTTAQSLADEVHQVLKGRQFNTFLANMYGNLPDQWNPNLIGPDRWRMITNYFTRMRFCNEASQLELKAKGTSEDNPSGFQPWFTHSNRKMKGERIVFGHWAALEGKANRRDVFALDTGYVWGGALTMMRLEDQRFWSCPA